MDYLIEKSIRKITQVECDFKRSLYGKINFKDKLFSVKGARGTGKTTLLLQFLKDNPLPFDQKLYLSLDDIYFAKNLISDVTRKFVHQGGKLLVLDEVHKYTYWSQEIKNIYDDYSDLQLVFTSSSLLNLDKGKADLSRRSMVYQLSELSFREFIHLFYKIEIPSFSITDILTGHIELAAEITKKIKVLKALKEYLKFGAYPFYKDSVESYYERLEAVVQTVLETDIPSVINVDFQSIINLKKLLSFIAFSVPFKPNISDLSRETGIARDTLLRYLHLLEQAGLIMLLNSDVKGMNKISKPEKIYLNNSNLMYVISSNLTNTGTMRETFFMNQLRQSVNINYTKTGDFKVNEQFTFEIGGKAKSNKQIQNIPNSFVVSDDIEIGNGNKIPLYLFGFLY